MINFFKRIRQRLFSENKFSKYLVYAIGEIILVVIGILIALQINNWNEHQKGKRNEVELLNSLKKELVQNIEHLAVIKSYNEAYKNASKGVLSKLDQKSSSFTTEEISSTFNYYSSTLNSPVLDAIIESNSNSLIVRKALINDLRDLKETYRRMEKSEYFLDEFWNSKVTDFFISCGFPFESHSSQDPLIQFEDFESGGYSKKQLFGLINMNSDLQKYCETRHSIAEIKSKEVLEKLQSD